MKILWLLDNAEDARATDADVRLADESGTMLASVRRDVARLLPQLDPSRVTIVIAATAAWRGPSDINVISLGATRQFELAVWRRLVALLRREDVELIHALGPRATLYALLARRLLEIPTIASLYQPGSISALIDPDRPFLRVRLWAARRGLDRLVVPSEQHIRELTQARYPPERIATIYPGVELGPQPQQSTLAEEKHASRAALGLPDGPLITMIAPLVQGQGHETVLEAYHRLLQRTPIANLAIYGAGLPWDALKRQLAQIKPPNPISWLGERQSMRTAILASDVIVVHPRSPGVPHALIETAALGRPAISSRVMGIMEVIDPAITGFQVTPGDARDLSVQMSKLLLQPAFAEQIGLRAWERAKQRFSLETQRDAITVLYESTIYSNR